MRLNNLLVVAGSGRNSGKTTFACRIIEQFSHLGITSIKISPHFHEPSSGLIHVSGKPGFEIYEETNRNTLKDSSRMLRSGAAKVYYIQTREDNLNEAFSEVYMNLAVDKPVICESPSLRNYIEPGAFIIMISDKVNKYKNIKHLQGLPHVTFNLEELEAIDYSPIGFEEGTWFYK